MKIKSVLIQNFRSCKHLCVDFSDYACLIGPNGSGKSTVLQALNVFFREESTTGLSYSILEAEDFHLGITSEPVVITVVFGELSEEAQADFADYYRGGQLVVKAIAKFDATTKRAIVEQKGVRLGMADFQPYFAAVKRKPGNEELQAIYDGLQSRFPLPAARTAPAREKALHEYEAANRELCTLIDSEDQFYGFSKGKDKLEKHVQWVYVPAVKEASQEQTENKNTAVGKLLQRTVRQKVDFSSRITQIRDAAQSDYDQLLSENQHILTDLSSSLRDRLQQWAHPNANLSLQWQQDADKSVKIDPPLGRVIAGESDFTGNIARLGHGLQRSLILALLQELATLAGDGKGGPTLILGCEEPEIYQHPLQARHLSEVLRELAAQGAQVLVTSHSPYFVEAESFEDIRVFRKKDDGQGTTVHAATLRAVSEKIAECRADPLDRPMGTLIKIHHALNVGINEMFFCERLILVESAEDRAYIATQIHLLDLWREFRRLGCAIIPAGRKSELLRPYLIARSLSIPAFLVFDADGHAKERQLDQHRVDNQSLLIALGYPEAPCFPEKHFFGECHAMWKEEIGNAVAADIGEKWNDCRDYADIRYGQAKGQRKYELNIAASLERAWNQGLQSESLKILCSNILTFASR